MFNTRFLIFLIALLLIACKADELEVDGAQDSASQPNGAAAALSEAEYSALTPEQQYQVANKLVGSFYKGVPAIDFFKFDDDISNLKVSGGKEFLSKTRAELSQTINNKERITEEGIPDKDGLVQALERRYDFNEERRPTAEPLAAIREFPISRDSFEIWMAYVLANTILFSPAQEIDSAGYIDVQRIHSGLVKAMSKDVSVRNIILTHMKSQANWRRFRSPEDNTREMIEIYLGLFDKDADVPKASIACKNWYLTSEFLDYELVIDVLNENAVPQQVLGEWVTTCDDFYEVVAQHPLVITRITTFLADIFFPNITAETRAEIVTDIVAQNPVYFSDIFLAILFSREYLLNNERPKNFEETFFNIAERINWKNQTNFLNQLTNPDSGSPNLHKMKQPSMSLKLGRFRNQPLDSLSFATFHEAVRERLLIANNPNSLWGGWDEEFVRDGDILSQDTFVHFLFLSVASRVASDEELTTLKTVFDATNNSEDRNDQTRIVFDYLSRLPELYYLNSIK